MRRMAVVVGLLVALVVSGCGGGDDDDPAESGGDGGEQVESADAGAESGGADADEPSSDGDTSDATEGGGLPVPLAPDAEVLFTDETDGIRTVLFTVPADQRDATIEFYEEWVGSQSGDFQRIDAEAGGVGWVGSEVQINISALLEGDQEAQVSLLVVG